MKLPELLRDGGWSNPRCFLLGLAAAAVALTACRSGAPGPAPAPAPRPLPALVLDDSLRPALLAVGRAVLDDALSKAKDTAAVCVVFVLPGRGEFRPEGTDLRVLADSSNRSGLRRRFVSITDCPKTYASMFVTDARGHAVDPRPAGYVDPHILRIHLPEQWIAKPDERSISVMVRVAQGMSTDEYVCRVRPAAARAATLRPDGSNARLAETAACRLDKQYVS